jgi:hypothetical protein
MLDARDYKRGTDRLTMGQSLITITLSLLLILICISLHAIAFFLEIDKMVLRSFILTVVEN